MFDERETGHVDQRQLTATADSRTDCTANENIAEKSADLSCNQLYEDVFDIFTISSTGSSLNEWQQSVRTRYGTNHEQDHCDKIANLLKHNHISDTGMKDDSINNDSNPDADPTTSLMLEIPPVESPLILESNGSGKGFECNEQGRDSGRAGSLQDRIQSKGHDSRVASTAVCSPRKAWCEDGRTGQTRDANGWNLRAFKSRIDESYGGLGSARERRNDSKPDDLRDQGAHHGEHAPATRRQGGVRQTCGPDVRTTSRPATEVCRVGHSDGGEHPGRGDSIPEDGETLSIFGAESERTSEEIRDQSREDGRDKGSSARISSNDLHGHGGKDDPGSDAKDQSRARRIDKFRKQRERRRAANVGSDETRSAKDEHSDGGAADGSLPPQPLKGEQVFRFSHYEGSDAGLVYRAVKMSYKDCSPDYLALVNTDRYDFVEICCSPNSVLADTCIQRGGKAYRINLASGYDLNTRAGIESAKEWIKKFKPREAWISLPCTPWSAMQNLTPMTPEREVKLGRQRKAARRMIRMVIELVRELISVGSSPAWEWPLRASSWTLPEMQELLSLLPHRARPDGCSFGMRSIDTNELILKSWRVQCRTQEQANRINIPCQGNHTHIPIEGSRRTNATSYYPIEMAKRWVRGLLKTPNMKDVCNRLMAIDKDGDETMDEGESSEGTQEPTKEEVNRVQTLLAKIHRNSAHCSNRNLARVLKDDGAPPWVVKAAYNFKCDVCAANSRPGIKPITSLNYETRLWHTVGVDQAELERQGHTTTFQLYVEGACGLCVPNVLFSRDHQSKEHRNPTATEVTDGFAETWIAHYPKPVRVRTDPEGSFQSHEFRDFLAANGIEYDPTAGEAHWQLDVERRIQTIKRIANKLSTEFPVASSKQILAAACSANNELERVKHYSPNQWAFGASKPFWEDAMIAPTETFKDVIELRMRAQNLFIREKAHERILTATRSKTRQHTIYEPGQKVMVWRAGKGTKSKPNWGGRWIGPAVVLVHQRNAEGPTKIVWCSLGGKLYRVAPEHLRPATEREGVVFDMTHPAMGDDPTTILQRGEFTDITQTPAPTDAELEQLGRNLVEEELPPDVVRRRIVGKQPRPQAPAAMEDQSKPREDPQPKRTRQVIQMIFSVDAKQFMSDPKKCLKKKIATEVSLRNLEGDELKEFEEAMAKELAEWIQEKALETVSKSEQAKIPEDRLLKMRWVLIWKKDPTSANGRKAKARIVVLGYQHPELEELKTAAPTLGRTGKHLCLVWASINHATAESADAKSAFLQGDGEELNENAPIYVKAIPEVAAAFDVPEGTAIKIAKAVYGLGNAPRSWYYSVHRKLEQLGGRVLKSEPCIWKFIDHTGTTIGLVAAYVDDFLIIGNHHNPEFMKLRGQIKDMYRWGEWQKGTFTLCGVRITQRLDFGFTMDQARFVHESLSCIELSKGPERKATEKEVSQLRGAHGGLQWKVTQTGPQFAAGLSLLQGQITTATTKTIKETNDLIKAAKANDYPITLHVHEQCKWTDLALVTWTDAAQGDRPDGGSTGGYITGFGRQDDIVNGSWTDISLVSWGTTKLPRVARSSLAAEIQEACIAEDEAYLIRLMWSEINQTSELGSDEQVNLVPAYLVTDAKALYDAVQSETSALGLKERRSGIELLGLKDNLKRNATTLRWVNSGAMLADPMTKGKMRYLLEEFLRVPQWKLVDDEKFESFKKRKLKGKDAFEKVTGSETEVEETSEIDDSNCERAEKPKTSSPM